ncbi:MAG: crossover junction endodeoxyribonuclease RuvC [Candidatus Komeilibacteria bacterium CG_4_10_14_0_2_um_filter_37_10]|uniref:Crossover junction endodeoxyribonuclease RuvC n=1 Tax=Candidatus Komeilibacteria bacterium CG_4_10_14_0_2_um_filter_37_10 TaxID=1974470 RepID=A0A2M7VDI7_9BACT|nr:MAG: crossover junction endodeoxyribonuclease RuvC [Candidatus Komeilibacteria bacterium CG_4_10_14_0_2_um_filter_37_10]PJA92455.1 MAG: crossover junction endodeoxyribonuclease RuvC [Candidatus Komeilibacteria bacterium CG_4_9_14_3_um_filter_37_5]
MVWERPKKLVVLGIDPGFADTGFGVVSSSDNKMKAMAFGSLKTKVNLDFGQRLLIIETGINKLIQQYQPDCLVVEQLFFCKNVTTALKVGQARGVVLLAAARMNLPVMEFTPLQVKQGLTGYGAASKNQVGQMVKLLLALDKVPQPDDAADALAMAICGIHSYKLKKIR